MAGPFDLTGQNIETTYQRVLQTDGVNIYDGTGSIFYVSGSGGPSISASYASTASYVQNAQTASYVQNAQTASYVLQAVSASYAPDTTFPYTGSAKITGSLGVTGSISNQVSGVTVLDSSQYTLYSTNTSGSVSWGSRFLQSDNAARVVRWNQQLLQDTSEINSIDWGGARATYDTSNKQSIKWGSRVLSDSTERTSVDWGNRKLYDSNSTPLESADWRLRTLKNNVGTTILDWQNATFTGSMLGTASYATQALSASWAPGSGGGMPSGSQGYIQYNDGGTFGSDDAFLYNTGSRSLSNGDGNVTNGTYSHAEGFHATTNAPYSHAEGTSTVTYGTGSHSEGANAISSGSYSHAEGNATEANGYASHAEGAGSVTIGAHSHAEGGSTTAYGDSSHTEGSATTTGWNTAYLSNNSGAGTATYILDASYIDVSGLIGAGTRIALDDRLYDNNYGYQTYIVSSSMFDGTNTIIQLCDISVNTTTAVIASITNFFLNSGNQLLGGTGAHSEGEGSYAYSLSSHAEGLNNVTLGYASHVEGFSNCAVGDSSHAEGSSTVAYGLYSHTEGNSTITYSEDSHAEGKGTIAGYRAYNNDGGITAGVFPLARLYRDLTALFFAGSFIILEDLTGIGISANGSPITRIVEVASSIFDGNNTIITLVDTSIDTGGSTKYNIGIYGTPDPIYADTTIGNMSHATGQLTQTIGYASSTEGISTISLGIAQSVVGQYNQPISDTSAFIVGDGVDDNNRHNLLVAASGSVTISGSIILPVTSSGATPSWTGTNGEMVFGDDGVGNYVIFAWLGGAWRSGSLF
jgi:hypothetical protein